METLVKLENNDIITTSRIIAETFGREHKNILKGIDKLLEEEKEDKEFVANFVATNYKKRGKLEIEYLINKDGFTFLVMGFTGKKARDFKKKYIKAFNKMEKVILGLETHKITDKYKKARLEGKLIRRDFTDILKELKIYAKLQNPNANTNFIYSNYTRVINKNLFNMNGKFKNVREKCNSEQLTTLKDLENKLGKIILDKIDKNEPQKLIYDEIKQKMEAYCDIFGKSEVIDNNLLLKGI